MNCLEINRLLDAQAFERMSASDQQTVELHFRHCETCRDAWATYREMAGEVPPETPVELRARVAAAIAERAPTEAHRLRRSLLFGGVLAVGAAVAAGIALQIAERTSSGLARHGEEPAPAAAPALPGASDAAPSTGALAIDAGLDEADDHSVATRNDAPPNPAEFALDAHSIVVVNVPDPAADARATAEFADCREQVLQQLRAVDGLNVIADQRVTAFASTSLQPEEIARALGAGTVLVLKIMNHQASCSATQLDTKTGDERSGLMVFVDSKRRPDEWTRFAATVAESVRDAAIKDSLTVLSDAEATVLNTALSDAERVAALSKLRGPGQRSLIAEGSTVVVAAAQIAMASHDAGARASAWVGLRGVRDPYLVQPLLYSLANDAEEDVRRAAAFDLAYFVDEPSVRDALERAAAEDPSGVRPGQCCTPTVREAARRSLLSDQELRDLAITTVLNDTLTDRERLQPLVSSPDGRALPVQLTEEAARAVLDLGKSSQDADFRARAWWTLVRASPQPAFAQAFLDDLAHHPEDNVRGAAAAGLAQYADDPAVRAALERAASEDRSHGVRQRASDALQRVAR
jgi:hypothetical protein